MAAPSKPVQIRFNRATIRFLQNLARNNERDWFNANKHRYESDVLAPSLAFIENMAPRLARISPHFLASAKRTGGSLMRVYRDTRFSSVKTPYKTNIGIQFRHERGRDVHAPGFYVHIEPGECFVGAGLWRPEPPALAGIREEIVEHPDLWRKASRGKRFLDTFSLAGESLKRPPKAFSENARYIEDVKRKDFIAIAPLKHGDVLADKFPDHVAGLFNRAAPLMRFLCGALDLDF